MECSIIIATCNRARALEKTLRCIDGISVPLDWKVELIVADNASTDDTREVVRRAKLQKIEVRYLYEGRRGKSNALNESLSQARGEALLFTDDDVAPTKDWLARLGNPLLRRECDGIQGRIELAPELCRPWMTHQHKIGLAVYEGPDFEPLQFIGANMGFHRSVLDKIPGYDTELGPGALGFGEEVLFSWQLAEAGFRLAYAAEASVTHYPDPSRLLRSNWLANGRKHGATMAYLLHHWFHEDLRSPRLRYFYVALKLRLRRLREPPRALDAEGIAPWEMSYVGELEKCRRFLIERKRPRKYPNGAANRRLL